MSGYAYGGRAAANPCQCGCGGEVGLARRTDLKRGMIKGKPNRFINGHNRTGFRPANAYRPRAAAS